MKEKSEVFKYFKEFKESVENKFEKKIATLRSDNGTEYKNLQMEQFCKENGIRTEYTVPHSPQQNGVAERMNRTLDDMARSLLIGAKLPTRFWPEAIQAAVHIRNRCPISTNRFKIPFELWNGKAAEYDQLVKFGSIAFALKLPTGGKFDPKSEKMIFVGYAEQAKAFKLYNPKSKKIIVSRDVEFIEDKSELPQEDSSDYFEQTDLVTLRSRLTEEKQATTQEVTAEEPLVALDVVTQNNEGVNERTVITAHPEDANAGRFVYLSNKEREEFERINPGINLNKRKGRPSIDRGQPGRPVKRFRFELNSMSVEPQTYTQALYSNENQQWQASMTEEYLAHLENKTWTLVEKPEDKKMLHMKWVYTIKKDEKGAVERFKSRLCIKGCAQRHGVDYEETFSPVIRYSGIRLLLTIAVNNGLEAHHVDIKAAYLNSDVDEDIFVYQPEGYAVKGKEQLVCKLNKAVYGLKQAARQWNLKLDEVLTSLGFESLPSEPCIYRHTTNHNLMVGVYVDDLIVIGREKDVIRFKLEIANKFKTTDKGQLKFCLNMFIEWSNDRKILKISQQNFVSELLQQYEMDNCKPKATPVAKGTIFKGAEPSEVIKQVTEYQSLVGSLLYLANCTRPDIAFAVSKLCQYIAAPSEAHITIAKRILRYLKGTAAHGC